MSGRPVFPFPCTNRPTKNSKLDKMTIWKRNNRSQSKPWSLVKLDCLQALIASVNETYQIRFSSDKLEHFYVNYLWIIVYSQCQHGFSDSKPNEGYD